MKIFLISDIHSENPEAVVDPYMDYDCLKFSYPEDADVVVLAGDIGEGLNGLIWARNRFVDKEIIYVCGNHEYYESDLSVIDDMRVIATELGIHLLDNDSVIMNGVRFLGTTLWTNFDNYSSEVIAEAERTMRDYHYIKCPAWWRNEHNKEKALRLMDSENAFGFDPECFSPTVAYVLHREALDWLSQQLNKPYQGKTVVVTHHAPSLRSIINIDYAYASDLEKFIANRADQIDLWCHGHIHQPVDYEVAGVRVVSNPRGYPTLPISKTFDAGKIICL
ncbi:metallophosphoesterase [Methylobacter sp.]|uniref:metallophosphoesterase n=1 Tax=Methylobacter sp. TaxID=2051955 RepID=UPI002FDD5F62